MLKTIVFLLAMTCNFLIGVFLGGYVLSILWGWFVVPLGVMKISTLHAAGLSTVLGTFMGTRGINHNEEKFDDAIIKMIIHPLAIALVGLFVGWIIHSLM